MILSLIVAASENNVIGKNNALPWSLPKDLQYFRKMTQGHPVIMGRKTFASIGRPLPNRRNIIISSLLKSHPPAGCEVFSTLEIAFKTLLESETDEQEVFVIGGERLFASVLHHTFLGTALDRIYLTRVHAQAEGDVSLPPIDWSQWKEVSAERHKADEKHAYPFTFYVYERKSA